MKLHIAETFKDWAEDNQLDFEYQPITNSTNDLAKKESSAIKSEFKVYITDQQTAGRGRNSNSWSNANPGDSLMCSFSFAQDGAPQAITGPLFGLNLFRAASLSLDHLNFSLKAPNDLLLNSKKCAGLLIEAIQMGQQTRLIVGLGLNVFSTPEKLQAAHLLKRDEINEKVLFILFSNIYNHFLVAARGSRAAHLTELERTDLLHALNLNENIEQKYTAISPFADLFIGDKSISWKEL